MLRKKLDGYEGAEPLSKTVSASVSEVSTPPSPSIVEDEEKEHDEGAVVPINTDLTRDGFEFVDRIDAAPAALDTYDEPVYEDGDDDKTTVVGDDGDVAEAFVREDDESTEVDDADAPTLAPKPSLSVFYSRKEVDHKRKRDDDDDEVAAEPASKKIKVVAPHPSPVVQKHRRTVNKWLLTCPCKWEHNFDDSNRILQNHRDACRRIYNRTSARSDHFFQRKFKQSNKDPEQATRNRKLWATFECTISEVIG